MTAPPLEKIADTVRAVFRKEAVVRAKLGAASGAVRSINSVVTQNELAIFGAVYLKYIETGRKAGVRKVPISALIFWAKRYQVKPMPGQTITGMCFAIQTGIYRNGIAPRPYSAAAAAEADKLVNPFLDEEVGRILDEAFLVLKLSQAT